MHLIREIIHWLTVHTGSSNQPGVAPNYNFWSGFGSDIAEFALIGTLIGLYKHHKCPVCWRLAHHPVAGTHYKTCHTHATKKKHDMLKVKHALKYPEQHKFLKEDNYGSKTK